MEDYNGSAAEVANRLLRSTITVGDSSINFEPALRRVGYDLEDIDAQIKQCVAENAPQLIETVQGVNECKKLVQTLEPDVENISLEYETLETDFIGPYQRLERAYMAAQRLHQTSELVRSCNWYLKGARDLELLMKHSPSSEINVNMAAETLEKLRQLLKANTHLQSLAVVRKHAETLGSFREKLVATALETIKSYNGGRQSLRNAVLGLCMLDKEKLLVSVDGWLKGQVAASVLGITRSVATSAAFDSAWQQTTDRANNVAYFSELLGESFMLIRAENRIGGPLVSEFWASVASNISQKLRTMAVANPSQSKAMKAQSKHILEKVANIKVVCDVFTKYLG